MQELDIQAIRQFGNIEFLARQVVEGFISGLHKSPYHGFSVEFAEHRLYNTGESTRHIDWKVYARTDKLFVKRYEEETNLRAQLLIDVSPSMYYPRSEQENGKYENGKITFSIMAAASIAYMLQKQRDAIGATTFSDKLELQTPIKATSKHIHTIFLEFQRLLNQPAPNNKKTSTAKVLHEIAERLHKRSLVIIFSDMLDNMNDTDELFAALQHLKHRHHEVLLFHVKDSKTETEFDFEDRPYIFTDVETGEKIKLQPAEVREYYQQQTKAKEQALKLKSGQYKIDFVEVDIRQPMDRILLPYLIKRAKMK